MAVIAGNLDLANVIQRHKPDDVGKFFFSFIHICLGNKTIADELVLSRKS